MPRVLRIINRLNLGGPTLNAAYLTRYMAPEFETLLVAGMIDESEASSEFVLHELDLKPVYIPEMYRDINPFKDIPAYLKLKRLIREFKPDIVHTHAAKAGALGRMAAHVCDVPVVVHTFHGHVFHSYFSKFKTNVFIGIERYLAKKSTRIIAISESQKRELTEEFRICEPENIEVIPLGLDLRKFSENQEVKRKKFRSYYLIEEDEMVITIVGRLVPVKNHSLFLSAIKEVLKRSNKKIRAFIVGDGEDKEKLLTLTRQLGIDFIDFTKQATLLAEMEMKETKEKKATVTFTSWIRQVDEVYAGSDIVVLSSLNEGTPVSIIEALAAGKPVVATDVGGIRDFVDDQSKGLIVPGNDVHALTAGLLRVLEDEELRRSMQARDKATVNERFSYIRLVQEMKALYTRLLNER